MALGVLGGWSVGNVGEIDEEWSTTGVNRDMLDIVCLSILFFLGIMLSIIERGCSRVSSCFVPILLSCRQQEVNKRLSFSGIEFPQLKVHTILHIIYSFLT
jgi:hypothetical protein